MLTTVYKMGFALAKFTLCWPVPRYFLRDGGTPGIASAPPDSRTVSFEGEEVFIGDIVSWLVLSVQYKPLTISK